MHKPLAAASLLLVTLLAAAAHAHAFLDHASPLVCGTVAAAPREAILWFTQSLEQPRGMLAPGGPSG
jgi:copper resistance protein C